MVKNILLVKTVQCAAIRNVFEALKDVLQDCNLVLDCNGMRCLQMDNNHNVLVSVKLMSKGFEEYQCESRVVAGINVSNMFRLVKSIGQSDTLTMIIEENNPYVMKMVIQNLDKNMESSLELNLLDIEEVKLDVPDTEFDSVLTMPSCIYRLSENLQRLVYTFRNNRNRKQQQTADTESRGRLRKANSENRRKR